MQIQLYLTKASSYDQIELFDFEGIELVQSIQDVRDIAKVFAEFTRTFTVPASRINNGVFKHFYNPDIGRESIPEDNLNFDATRRLDAELHLNFLLFKKGRLQLDAVNMKDNKPYSYTVTFFGDTVKLAETLGDQTLNTLAGLSNISFDYTSTDIINLMGNADDVTIGSDTFADSLLFPLITSTQRLVYDSVDNTKENNLYPHGNYKGVDYRDLKPALRIHTIIKAIENQYTNIQFDSSFFNTTNLPYYNLFMWLNKEKGKIDIESPQRKLKASDFTAAVGDTSETGLRPSSTPAGGRFDGAQDIFFKHSKVEYFLDVKIFPSNSDSYNFVLKKDNQEFFRVNNLSGDKHPMNMKGFSSEGSPRIDLPEGLYTFHLETTSAIDFDLNIAVKRNRPSRVGQIVGQLNTFVISYTASYSFVTAVEKNTSELIPNKIKIIDFLTGLFKMFNLTAVVNNDGVIEVKTLSNFYASGQTVNLTKYTDITESTIESIIPFSSIEFKYDGLDTIFASQHEEIAGKPWGTAMWPNRTADSNSDDFLEVGESYEIVVPFEHHKFNRLYAGDVVNVNNLTNIQYGYSVDSDENSIVGKPLLFYPILPSTEGITQEQIEVVIATTASQNISSYYVPSNSLKLLPDADLKNINFYAEANEYSGNPFTGTLYEEYYDDYITQTFDPASRIYKYKAKIPDDVLRELKLNDSVIIFDYTFRVNKIVTNFLTGMTQLELINKSNLLESLDNENDYTDNVSKTYNTVDTTKVTVDLTTRTV